jgi:hypothetical protein
MIEGSRKKARILLENTVRFRAGDRASTVGMRLQVLSQLIQTLRKAADQTILGMAEDVVGHPDADLFEITLVPFRLPWVEIGSPACSLHRPLSR